jgi:FkbM family methyltransferase
MRDMDFVRHFFPSGGYYLEAGAHDGIGDSKTCELEQLGTWRGLCVEPSSAFYGLCLSRKCSVDNRCLWDKDELVAFRQVNGNGVELSGVAEHFPRSPTQAYREAYQWVDRTVEGVTLAALLWQHDAPREVSFMSLDLEGAEMKVLRGYFHGQDRDYVFQSLLVEYLGALEKRTDLMRLLCPRGYQLVHNNGTDLLFVHESAI